MGCFDEDFIYDYRFVLELQHGLRCFFAKKVIKMASTQNVIVSRFFLYSVSDDHRLNDAPRGGHGNLQDNPAFKSPLKTSDRVKGKHLND